MYKSLIALLVVTASTALVAAPTSYTAQQQQQQLHEASERVKRLGGPFTNEQLKLLPPDIEFLVQTAGVPEYRCWEYYDAIWVGVDAGCVFL